MASPAQLHTYSQDFAFQFDAPFPSRVYDSVLSLSGWLVDRKARPIYGLRAIIRRNFFGRKICRARRKRERPDVATAFPKLPGAAASGFLFELKLGAGSNRISFQVQDHKRVWRTFHAVNIIAKPLNFLDLLGFRQFRLALVRVLEGSFSQRDRPTTPSRLSRKPELNKSSLGSTISAITKIDLLATSKSNLFIREIGELIAAGFRDIGCETRILLDREPAEDPSPDTLQIVVTPHEYYNLFLTQRTGFEKAQELTRQVVLLCTEQPETEWFQSNLWWTSQARAVADISPLGAAAYRARGLACYCLPLGYHPILGIAQSVEGERSYDVTFLGSMTHRRDSFFAKNAPFFSEHRCHIRLVPLGFAKTKQTRSYLSVQKRNELLSQTKLLLNVHYSDQKYFEWHRMLMGIANGCCVISEKCEGYGALVPGKHFIMVDQDELIEACDYYLKNPGERNRIASNALSFVKDKLNQAENCRVFLRQYQTGAGLELPDATVHIDADLPFDAKPVALPSLLRQRLTQQSRLSLIRAASIDLQRIRSAFFAHRHKPIKKPRLSGITSEEIENKRRGFRLRWLQQEKATLEGQAILERHENDAYRSIDKPILSVVITLHNYAHFIGDCIASIEQAIEKIDTSAEIVIVNDASDDDSLIQALHYQEISRTPILIANKHWNTGLADSRNKAIHLARGKYVFMMDADNLVLARGLKELLALLEGNNYDAAYTIICRFRDTPENRLGLLSYFDWDPQILAQYPYIDAMAMFRRDVLLELSGYDNQLSQIGWFGWEDYDLWLKFAVKNYKVGFVPNILCLYRIHETSMIHTTTLYELELVHHLVENYGELLDRFEPQKRVFGVDRERVFDSADRSPYDNGNSVELANEVVRNNIGMVND
ncbi:MAG TPA: glycosyltransferase [Chthoniobacterales bacterium]